VTYGHWAWRTECAFTGRLIIPPLLDKRTHRSEYINVTDHADQLSRIGCQHGHRTNFLLQQDV